ncbi:SPOR domain-containing protein [Oceanicaulis alexandrii]|uniref:SPOR domain-containing protein n=2 Tax=Oceanicaulis alexandrii TaxID=153233 RepID=UPI0003B57B33
MVYAAVRRRITVALTGVEREMTDDDTRYGAYAPPPDDYDTYDAREDEQDRRGWLFLGASAVVFILFVAVVYNTFQLGVRERGENPVITADAEPYRVAPEDPGGYEAPDQDLSAYELREGESDPAETETPPARTVSEEPVTQQPAPEVEMPALQVETASADALDEPAERAPDPEPEPEPARTEPARPDPAPAQPAPARTEPRTQTAAQTEGAYVAQIGAFRSREDAEAGWVAFTSRFSDLAIGHAPDIQRADLGDRGVFHRLRVAAFTSREEAAQFCASLDARGQACLVARR